ncbi:hypothetical protein ACHHYP_09763 [Achlya hypogyna]|uniref:Uncharacterized protein n=1 Tax=Achlya hypogyna TaxID=1202772 RepID=A0A1V9YMG7_ACHHY|nr:hypothetical protein ACHHYP_09763 [Achlya hypogyna]
MHWDRIRLINFPVDANDWIVHAVERSWPQGVQSTKHRPRAFEIKLGGYPWNPSGRSAVHGRQLMLEILIVLKRYGYVLHSSSDVSNSSSTCDTLFFRRDAPEANASMLALSTNSSDIFRLINAPAELGAVVHSLIERYWPRGLQRRTDDYAPGCIDFKMHGYP